MTAGAAELADAHVREWAHVADRPPGRAERRRQHMIDDRAARLHEALDLLHPGSAPIHIRTPDRPGFGVGAGYFTNDDIGRQALVDAVRQLVGSCDIWVNLNPFNQSLVARAFNTIKRARSGACVSDKDITERRWILIDCDPRRPEGISSTEAEHTAAINRAYHVRDFLVAAGFPIDALAIADSGNGAHVYVRVGLPNDQATTKLVQKFLDALDLQLSDDAVGIDGSTFNASRVVKLPGTIATKGDNIPDRPHREAVLLEAPVTIAVAPVELIEIVADTVVEQPKKTTAPQAADDWPDAEQWCADRGLSIIHSAPYGDGHKFILAACPFDSSHDNGAALLIQWANRAVVFRCLHNSCTGKDWNALRDLHEPGWRERWKSEHLRQIKTPERTERHAPPEDRERVEIETAPRQTLSAPNFPAAAMPGPYGELVHILEPWTEAHPASIVLPALILLGVSGGEGVRVGKQRPLEYLAIVGETTVGRKDTGLDLAVDFVVEHVGIRWPKFGQPNSGEGIWFALRDATEKDPGADDKRLTLIDTEMAGTLAAITRPGSTVLPSMLSLYDKGSRETLTKNDRVTVSNAHFSYIGLTVPSEFGLHMTDSIRRSGFMQRLLIAAVHRVRAVKCSHALEPEPDLIALAAIAERILKRMEFAVGRTRQWHLSAGARAYLDDIAPSLVDEGRPETARAVPHVYRLAMLYALTVEPEIATEDEALPGCVALSHLRAAEAAWRYCSESAAQVLGDDPLVEKIVMLAQDAPSGITRTDLFRLTGNNITAKQLDDAIHRGRERGKLRLVEVHTGQRGRRPQLVMAT